MAPGTGTVRECECARACVYTQGGKSAPHLLPACFSFSGVQEEGGSKEMDKVFSSLGMGLHALPLFSLDYLNQFLLASDSSPRFENIGTTRRLSLVDSAR